MSSTLAHLTLNTGHLRASPRTEVAPATIALLTPLIADGGGPLPPPFDGYRLLVVNPDPGEAVFTVQRQRDGRPLVTCFYCWSPERAASLWQLVVEQVATLARQFPPGALPRRLPTMPAATPWLAVLIWPTVAADPAAAGWLGDLERCVAWALIEHGGRVDD